MVVRHGAATGFAAWRATRCNGAGAGKVAALLAVLLVEHALTSAPSALQAAPADGKVQDRILPDEPEADGAKKHTDSLLPHLPRGSRIDSPLRPGMDAGMDAGTEGEEAIPFIPRDGEQEAGPSLEEIIAEDIPDLQVVELTEDAAKRALDAFEQVFGKFDDEEIARFPTLQAFAEKSEQGRKFAAIIRKHGFRSVKEWNDTITNIGFAYSSIEEGHDDEIFRQIKEAEARTDLPKERKEKLLKYLRALIPSVNNRKVVQALLADRTYARKLQLLEGGVAPAAGEAEPEEPEEPVDSDAAQGTGKERP